jgi:hypothetical protein
MEGKEMSNINTVGKLIEELSKLDKEAPVEIKIAFKNTMYDVVDVDYYSGKCVIIVSGR